MKPYPVKNPDPTHVVIEMFGGDNNLSDFVREDILEMVDGMAAGFTALCLTDTFGGTGQVIEVSAAGYEVIEELGEINTGDPGVLADFLGRALVTYSGVSHIAIGFWDHGSGIFDEMDSDEDLLESRKPGQPVSLPSRQIRVRPARRLFGLGRPLEERAMLHDDTNGGVLTNREAGRMLQAAFAGAGREDKVDMIFSDTCLNGMVEVLSELAPFARVITGSSDLEPGDGWDYHGWFESLAKTPPSDADSWGRAAVEAFGSYYRSKILLHPCTLGAFRTGAPVTDSFHALIATVSHHGETGFDWMRKARDYCQSFDRFASYDLQHFGELMMQMAGDDNVRTAAGALVESVNLSRVHSVAQGHSVPDSHGLAFWFPPTRYSFIKDAGTYRHLAFDRKTGWSQYLADRYQIGPSSLS